MSDKPALPAPGRISIRILNLSTEVQSTLREVGIRTVGHLFRPTEAQQAHLRERLVPASARELLGKTRSFYRTYRKVQKLLAEAESVQTDTPVGEQALKERPQPAEMPVEDEESPLPGASAAEEEMVAEVTGKRIEQPASNHGAAAEAALAEVPIAELSVPGPALARLEQRGIETALDLAERSDAELAEIRYVGAAVIARIRNQLRELREEYARNAASTEDDSAPPSHDKSSIEVLELSASAFHALSRAGIHQLHQLLALTHEELLDIRSLGPTLAHEIEERLEEYLGQSLAEVRAQSEVKQKAAGISKAHLRAPLSALNLTTRAHNALQRSGVETVRALLIMPEAVLAQLYGVGDTALNDIQEKLDAFLARPAPVEPPALTLPALPETDLPEVLEAWFDQFLSSREREIVERRYGLFSEGQTLETIGEQFGVTRERIRQIQLVALEKLESDLSPIAELLELARGELATKEGILPLETWADMLQAQPFSLGAVRPRGLLDLLSDLEETWIVYAIGEGVLFDGISTRAKAEAKLAEWQSTQTGSAALVPSRVEEPTAAPEPLPKQVPRPQTRKVTAADLAPTSVPSTAAEVEVAHDSPFYEIEMALREKLSKVDFIGELAIEEEQFREWCELVQTHAVEDGRFQPRQIPPAAFVTQMVFAARYSEEEARNFWQPYAQMVWGLEEASQYFQLRCRNRFKQAIAFLTEHYDLFFPQRSAGDLVRPIYRHAIIPAYLERKFVDWLKSHWREILETPEGFLIPRLRQERSLNYLSPTLQNFIQGADTAETAAALIRNMATAASLHAEGEALADIHDLLAGSPIEQSLWDELSQVYVEQADLGEPRRLSHRLEWLWNLETGEMQLRLRNLYLTGDVTPYQIVWVEDDLPAEEAVFADVYETLDPWEVEDEWLIDEVVFAPDGPLNGVLKVLGDDDSLLRQLTVPPLPKMPAQFFRRLTHQEVYAIPVTPDNVQTGQYLVAVQPGVHLSGPENEVLEATSTLTLPYLLHDHFESAGFYEIDLPLTILEDGAEMETLTPSATTTSSDPAYIYGEAALAGLSRRVPPLYCSDQIWLVIPGASERLLAQGTVEIRPQQGRARRLLLKEMEVEADETGALWVPLRGLMGRKADGTYTVELRRGLRSLLQAPLQFSCIPGFEAIPPPERPSGTPVYTPNQPPAVRLRGIEAEQIGSRERLTVTTGIDGWIEVTWHDLRGGCRLPLSINNQQVPLEWPVSRFFAWVEPAPEGNVLTWEMVKEATLHAVATESVDYFFVSVGANPQRRQLSLDRYGRKRIPIWQDQLYDMLRHERGAEVKIYVSVFNENWSLFTLRRHPELHGVRVKHDPARDILIFENNLKGSWPGDFHFQVQQLSNPSATPRVLESVRQLESRHLIPCELADGIYQFEVWDPGAGRALAKEIFGVGEVERSAFFDEAVRLLESLSRDTAHRLPRWLGGDMIRFLAAETDRTEEGQADLAPEWLWQLALLQPRAYAAAADDELEALWSPLLRLRQVHQVDEWEEEHGLLPDWAVMPFRMTLRFQPFGNSITIEPEVVSREGRRGIGHAFLKMGEDHRPVYVSWKPHYREQVVVTLGLPDQSPDDVDYVQLDEWDMYSVYQCRRCGRLVDSNIAPEVLAKHRHGRQKADLEDVLTYPSDYRLLAEVTPKRREEIRDYRLGPAYFVDRQRVRAWLNDPGLALPDISNAGHPLGPDAYLHISSRWVARYRQSFEVAQALQELVGDRARRKAFARLAAFLSESRWFDVGAWAALGRFLAAFPSEPDEPLLNVDRYSLMLALLARTRVHAPARADQLRTQIGLHDAKLAEMLQLLNRYCPELVVWAFNWVELFFIHAAG